MNALQEHVAYSTYYLQKGQGVADDEREDLISLGTMQESLLVRLIIDSQGCQPALFMIQYNNYLRFTLESRKLEFIWQKFDKSAKENESRS